MLKDNETFKEFGYYSDSLSKRSHKPIICECDYCYKLYKTNKDKRTNAHKKLSKDACKKCGFKKQEEISLKEHGCKNPLQRKEVKEKIKQTNLKRYGVECPLKNAKIKDKIKQTNLKRYGVEHSAQQAKQTKIDNGLIKTYDSKTIPEWADKIGKSETNLRKYIKKYGFEEALKISKNISSLEQCVKILLDEENIKYKQHAKIKNKYCDFLIGDLVLELDGLYWHCDKINKDDNYHINKKELYNKLGYKSLFFRENEINDQFEIVTSMIKNQLGMGERVFARKCKFEEISKKDAKEFYVDNHLMGVGRGTPYALTYNNEIISVMQIKRTKGQNYEVSRFCTVLNTNIVGGFSKLLKNVEKVLDIDSLKTFIDCRYGVGDYLNDFGFKKETCYKSFKWVNGQNIVNRMKFPGNTGYEHGYAKIWDCGQAKYVKYYNASKGINE